MAADQDDQVPGLDLSPLDPTRDRHGFDHAVSRIVAEARVELARRRGTDARAPWVGATPALWGRVAWPVAAAVALASVAVLRIGEPAMGATPDEELARAVGVPEALAPWVGSETAPPISEILVGWEEDR